MAKRLLDRQVSLLHYLTSGGAIFGGNDRAAVDAVLQGIDPALLNVEARFSHEKRLEKIAAVFPRTFALLDTSLETLIRAFVDACPPADIGRLENARQFHDFLSAQWRLQAPQPAFLPDVAACELALATVRAAAEDRSSESAQRPQDISPARVRRRPSVVLQRCAYDIRPAFEDGSVAIPVKRDTRLAIAATQAAGEPEIYELAPAVFDLLTALDDWTDLAGLGDLPEADKLLANLSDAGLLEVGR